MMNLGEPIARSIIETAFIVWRKPGRANNNDDTRSFETMGKVPNRLIRFKL